MDTPEQWALKSEQERLEEAFRRFEKGGEDSLVYKVLPDLGYDRKKDYPNFLAKFISKFGKKPSDVQPKNIEYIQKKSAEKHKLDQQTVLQQSIPSPTIGELDSQQEKLNVVTSSYYPPEGYGKALELMIKDVEEIKELIMSDHSTLHILNKLEYGRENHLSDIFNYIEKKNLFVWNKERLEKISKPSDEKYLSKIDKKITKYPEIVYGKILTEVARDNLRDILPDLPESVQLAVKKLRAYLPTGDGKAIQPGGVEIILLRIYSELNNQERIEAKKHMRGIIETTFGQRASEAIYGPRVGIFRPRENRSQGVFDDY